MSPFNEPQLNNSMHNDNLMQIAMTTPAMYEYPTCIENNNYPRGSMMMNNSSSQVSLSEASVCSSMDIRTPDMHPVADNHHSMSVTQATCYSMTQQWNHDPVVVWPMPGLNKCLSYPTIKSEYDALNKNNDLIYGENTTNSSSMRRNSHNNRRNTVSLPLWCDNESNIIKQEDLKRQSMNDLNSFCHLTREQLIQRVVQLEKEKQLSACNHTSVIGSISPVLRSTSSDVALDHSDQDDIHPCLWSGCDTSANSLDQLISHIRDIHIGSGKAAYYCEWSCCTRNQKPFLKRHKMQNHMRTHTGERPFECHIEECDKKFSRPDSLNTHIKTHSSVRPYACPVDNCGKAYFHSRSLRKHAKSHEATHLTPHPYNRHLKPNKFNQQQQQEETPTTNTTPMQQQQIPFSTFYADVKIMDNYEQQQQQIFAAGTAYYHPVQPHYVSNNPTYEHQLMEPY